MSELSLRTSAIVFNLAHLILESGVASVAHLLQRGLDALQRADVVKATHAQFASRHHLRHDALFKVVQCETLEAFPLRRLRLWCAWAPILVQLGCHEEFGC